MFESNPNAPNAVRVTLTELLACLPPEVGALIAKRSGEARANIRHQLDLANQHAFGECRGCKSCNQLKPVYTFEPSPNSDDGLFPYCRSCVARMEFKHEQKYNYYFPNRMER